MPSDDGTAAPPDTQATPRPTPIITRVEVAPREFTAGQTARIVVTARNTSTDTLRFTFSSACQLIYEIRDSSGIRVAHNLAHPPMTTVLVLGPGETRSEGFDWDGLREDDPEHPPLPAGVYRVRGLLCFPLERRNFPSQPVTVRLLSPH